MRGLSVIWGRLNRGGLFDFSAASLSDGTAHILAATHRRLDLAVAVGTLGYLNVPAIGQFQVVVFKRSITLGACCVHAHTTFCTAISCHQSLLVVWLLRVDIDFE